MTMTDQMVCDLAKNARESIRFRLVEFKGHSFIDVRIFTVEEGKDPAPTKKGMALAQVEAALIQEGWLDHEDLKTTEGKEGAEGEVRRPEGRAGGKAPLAFGSMIELKK
jgi:Transcriptional Coactivator p15 (PC4)